MRELGRDMGTGVRKFARGATVAVAKGVEFARGSRGCGRAWGDRMLRSRNEVFGLNVAGDA